VLSPATPPPMIITSAEFACDMDSFLCATRLRQCVPLAPPVLESQNAL
jgi:hypothetical protein